MGNAKRKETVRRETYSIHILGAPAPGVRDLYHALLRVPWWAALAIIVGSYLALNVVFAALYLWAGGVANAAARLVRSTPSSSACRPWAPSATAPCTRSAAPPTCWWSPNRSPAWS